MNMPLKPDGTVTFTATLFAVIRTSLRIKMDGACIDTCNRELKVIVQKVWKRTPQNIFDAIFPPPGSGKQNSKLILIKCRFYVTAFGFYEYAAKFRRIC